MDKRIVWLAVGLGASLVLTGYASGRGHKQTQIKIHSVQDALKHFQKGYALVNQGNLDAGISEIQAALEHEPDEAYWHSALGEALERKGDHQKAVQEYALACKYSPHDDGLKLKFDQISGVEKGPGSAATPVYTIPGLSKPGSTSDAVTPPRMIKTPEPPYSQKARHAKYQGVCVLLAVVEPDGRIGDVSVIRPLGLGLDQKAIETVRMWELKPGTKNGKPVPVRVTIEVTFRLF